MANTPTYSGNRSNNPNACQGCGRYRDTITRAITTKGHAVRLCSECLGRARSLGHIRNEAEHGTNVRSIRSLPIGQTVTLAGDGISLDRQLDDRSARPVMIDDGTPKPTA